jgi:predicted NAD-dependent protein-ADP-ribosyltransferase YbiA (DUF1768 family)
MEEDLEKDLSSQEDENILSSADTNSSSNSNNSSLSTASSSKSNNSSLNTTSSSKSNNSSLSTASSSNSNNSSLNTTSSSITSLENKAMPEIKQTKEKEKSKKGPIQRIQIQPKTAKQFFRARSKDPKRYTFTPEGDLRVPAEGNQTETIIPLQKYRTITVEEREKIEKEREIKLIEKEREFDETLALFRNEDKMSDKFAIQDRLKIIDAERRVLRSPYQWKTEFENIKFNQIDFSNRYNDKVVQYPILKLNLRSFTFEEEFVVDNSIPKAQEGGAEEQEEDLELTLQTEGESAPEEFTFFNEPHQQNGFLSPDTMLSFVYKGVEYNSPLQAYHGYRFEKLGRREQRVFLLKQTTAQGIRKFAQTITGEFEDPRQEWVSILEEFVKFQPDIKSQLAQTEGTTLVYADAMNTKWGIGLSMEDPLKEDRANWTGENLLGQAWMGVRAKLEDVDGPPEGEPEAVEKAQTTEDVKRRSGVLANMYKMKKAVQFA